jgi:hypothetical protein
MPDGPRKGPPGIVARGSGALEAALTLGMPGLQRGMVGSSEITYARQGTRFAA